MASMLIRASTVNVNALINVGWSFFRLTAPRVVGERGNAPTVGHQSR